MGSCERGVYTMPIVQACAQRVSAQCLVHSAEVDCGLFVPGVHRTARARALVCVCVCVRVTLLCFMMILTCIKFLCRGRKQDHQSSSNKDTDEFLVISIGTPMDVPANPNLTCDGNCVAVLFVFKAVCFSLTIMRDHFLLRSVPFFISIVLILGRINFGSIP